jgi:hypothetical protein
MTLTFNKSEILKLKEFAEAHPISREELLRISKGKAKCVGDRDGYSLFLPTKYRLVYSIEYTPSADFKQTYKCRKMSISVAKMKGDKEQKWVSKPALNLLSQMLGFSDLEADNVMVDYNEDDSIPNISVTEILGGTPITPEVRMPPN